MRSKPEADFPMILLLMEQGNKLDYNRGTRKEMKNKVRKPRLYVIAGPNGAGKTTFAREFLPRDVKCLEFVNADFIAGALSPFAPERAAFRAGRFMLERIHSLGKQGLDFGFETTLSGKTYVKLLRDLKEGGYQVYVYFLWIKSVKLSLDRIKTRVKSGGHDVPEPVVRRRFGKSLPNFLRYYKPLADSWAIFDNSGDEPKMIAFEEGGVLEILDPTLFGLILKHKE
jgi:predicted ABC-type ATPase